MAKSESQILAEIVENTRQLTLSYIQQLKGVDLYREFECEGVKLNSVFWIMGHLPVTQNFLLLRSTGGEAVRIPWARTFGMGATPLIQSEYPSLEEVEATLHEVHSQCVRHVAGLQEESLGNKNTTGFSILGQDTIKSVIVHAIRHENMHAGHLSWLCKLHGLQTI